MGCDRCGCRARFLHVAWNMEELRRKKEMEKYEKVIVEHIDEKPRFFIKTSKGIFLTTKKDVVNFIKQNTGNEFDMEVVANSGEILKIWARPSLLASEKEEKNGNID